jgi:multidrug efflux pump subunit AcrA (membrane-fusion protein)
MTVIDSSTQRIRGIFSWFFKASMLMKGLIIIVLIGLVWFIGQKVLVKGSTAQQYQTTQVERGTLITNVSASGTVASGNSSSISTSATGVVNTLYVKNGDTVSAGDKIADITLDRDSQQQQAAAYASYLGAQNSLNSAKSKMNSLQSALFKANQAFINDKGISDPDKADPKYIEENADWQQAEADYTNQSGVIAQAEASLTSAALSYQQYSSTIVAPTTGVISNLSIAEGTAVSGSSSSSNSSSSTSTSSTTSSSQSLGTITAAQNQLQAKVNLSEVDITTVEVGQKVTMTLDAFADKTFTGKVSAIDTTGAVSSGVTTYPVTITFDTGDSHIYPNMAVSATIITSIKDDVLIVPSTAIQTTNGTSSVRVLKNGQSQQVTVTTGNTSDTETEITSGLNEGDTVITSTISTGTTTTGSTSTASPFGGSTLRGVGGFGGAGTTRRAN